MINVIGLGYIGLPTALMFSSTGLKVVGTDVDKDLISNLNQGLIPIDEKGMIDLFEKAVENEIEFTTEYVKTDKYVITVPTPYDKDTKKIDLSYVINALEQILEVCRDNSIIIVESTISPGSSEKFLSPIINQSDKKIHLVHAPERIIPGNMIYELQHNSRTIGSDNYDIGVEVKKLYSRFCKSEIIVTDIKSAEMSKVIENTYRDINIAFANELSKICHVANINVNEIIRIANQHPRVNILSPGPGVGGHCIPVDPWFLVGDYPDHTDLIRTAREVNSNMPKYVIQRLETIMKKHDIKSYKKVGIYGLTYKENVEDVRESPTLQLLNFLTEKQRTEITIYDPLVKEKIIDGQVFDIESLNKNSEIIVLMVNHRKLDQDINALAHQIILDTKNIFAKNTLKNRLYRL